MTSRRTGRNVGMIGSNNSITVVTGDRRIVVSHNDGSECTCPDSIRIGQRLTLDDILIDELIKELTVELECRASSINDTASWEDDCIVFQDNGHGYELTTLMYGVIDINILCHYLCSHKQI